MLVPMKKLFFLTLILLWAIPTQAAFEKTKLAVFDFTLQGDNYGYEDLGGIVAEWFITALVKEGRFDVIERTHIQKIIAEQKLGMSGLVEESSAASVGKVLGVKTIITGSVMSLPEGLEVNARIIDVETGSIIAAENVSSPTSDGLQQLITDIAKLISKNYPLEGYIVERNGKEVTLDLGAATGIRHGMTFIAFKEGKVIRHPKTGQVLDITQEETGTIIITEVRPKIAYGTIISETIPHAIAYGQSVKNSQPGATKSRRKHQRSQVDHKPLHNSVASGEAPLNW